MIQPRQSHSAILRWPQDGGDLAKELHYVVMRQASSDGGRRWAKEIKQAASLSGRNFTIKGSPCAPGALPLL